MSLSSGKYQLLCDRQSVSGAYRLILAIRTLVAFQLVAMNVGSNDAGICNVIPDIGNDRSSV